jgi:hypothetical protein
MKGLPRLQQDREKEREEGEGEIFFLSSEDTRSRGIMWFGRRKERRKFEKQ